MEKARQIRSYESNRVLQITNPFKDKVFRLAKRLLISKRNRGCYSRDFKVNCGVKNGCFKLGGMGALP
jgi:hypothetical protein